jgi:cobalamin biosynthesis Mg chelatase CobN
MSRLLFLTSMSLIAILMFAAVALAQEGDDGGQPAATGAESGRGQPRVVTSAEATGAAVDGGGGTTATASPTATATESPTATATASPTASTTALARTGGPVSVSGLVGLMAAVVLVSGGVMSFARYRRI